MDQSSFYILAILLYWNIDRAVAALSYILFPKLVHCPSLLRSVLILGSLKKQNPNVNTRGLSEGRKGSIFLFFFLYFLFLFFFLLFFPFIVFIIPFLCFFPIFSWCIFSLSCCKIFSRAWALNLWVTPCIL